MSLYDKFKNPSAYQSQLRSRLSNLRTNEKLRYEVATLTIQPIAFVSMSAQEMASDEKRKKIQADLAEQAEAARSDWALANHDKLQEQAGVSQDSVSMYRCPACRSEKVRTKSGFSDSILGMSALVKAPTRTFSLRTSGGRTA